MNALFINGSPRKRGNTYLIANQIMEGLKSNGIMTKEINLSEFTIKYCTGCKNCEKTGDCIIQDDVPHIISAIDQSDIIIIGSPSYWGDITGQLKVFFDRNTPYSDTNMNDKRRRIKTGKIGIAISVRAGATERENVHIIECIEHYYSHLGIKSVASISATGIEEVGDILNHPSVLEKAFELGSRVSIV
jgi:multimeric flavodoxin WrbA